LFFVELDILGNWLFSAIGFGKDDSERNLILAKLIGEFQIYFLGWDSSINQLKYA
jgi:hypothetical protein